MYFWRGRTNIQHHSSVILQIVPLCYKKPTTIASWHLEWNNVSFSRTRFHQLEDVNVSSVRHSSLYQSKHVWIYLQIQLFTCIDLLWCNCDTWLSRTTGVYCVERATRDKCVAVSSINIRGHTARLVVEDYFLRRKLTLLAFWRLLFTHKKYLLVEDSFLHNKITCSLKFTFYTRRLPARWRLRFTQEDYLLVEVYFLHKKITCSLKITFYIIRLLARWSLLFTQEDYLLVEDYVLHKKITCSLKFTFYTRRLRARWRLRFT